MIKLILFLLSLHAMKNVCAANIDGSVTIGKGTNIDPSVVIKAKSQIGNFVNITASTRIGENCRVGDHVDIAKHCTIANDVVVGKSVKIGSNVKIGNAARVNEKASIGNGVEIGDDSLIDEASEISDNAKISSKVYIGRSASVPANMVVNEYAILHERAKIPSGYTVKHSEVVICSPSPVQLHKDSASIESISNDQLQIANDNSSAPSKAFNDMLRVLLDDQIKDVKVKCSQENTITTPDLSVIKSLFLIQHHGVERFNQTYHKVRELMWSISVNNGNGEMWFNDYRIPPAFHFGENEDNDILDPDVKRKFIQLLEIEEDSKRVNRVKNDIFCSVTAQVLYGDRDVTVTDPYHKNFANNSRFNLILISTMLLTYGYSLFFNSCLEFKLEIVQLV